MKHLVLSAVLLFTACSEDKATGPAKSENSTQPTAVVGDAAKTKSETLAAPTSDAAVLLDAAASPAASLTDAATKAASSEEVDDNDVPDSAGPTNLQVLPKKWTTKRVNRYMKQMTRGLGVKCKHCHVGDDKASDKLEPKLNARKMLGMTRGLDRKYMGGKGKLTCFTCHKGKLEPQ